MNTAVGHQARSEVAIGVVGPRDMVERIMLMGRESGHRDWRLVGSSHAEEHEAVERLRRIENSIDVALFTSRLQYDLVRDTGGLTVPATYVPLAGAALCSALLRGMVAADCDPTRVSIDSLAPADVTEAYGEIGVSTDGVRLIEYRRPESVKQFFAFHERCHRQGGTGMALTTVRSVYQRLVAAGIPAVRLTPPGGTLRTALNTAALLGTGSRLEESQIAVAVVELAAAARPGYPGPSNYWQQELRLSLHQTLLREARRMGATVLTRDEAGYLVLTTVGALATATEGFRVAPFVERARTELALAVEVGIGLGRTARDAEAHALRAVEKARDGEAGTAYLIGEQGAAVALPSRPRQPTSAPVDEPVSSKGLETLARLADLLGPGTDAPIVVDADRVAEVLGVTSRSARRTLHGLVSEGLAWPMPPVRSAQAGRPRQPYRLVTEKLERLAE